ncbi:MAG: hypothetical protein ACOZAO_03550 [Patescibacteria group bacterium]
MPKKKKPNYYRQQKYNKSQDVVTEKDLLMRLGLTITAIFVTLGILYVSFTFFGPKIGSLFGLFSVHRNETGPQDNLAPTPPAFSSPPVATKKDTITLEGLAEAGTNVKLFVNGPEVTSTVSDSEGVFTFTNVKLIEGNNTIFARAYDQSNNESPKSVTLSIKYDIKEPEIEIISPEDGETIKNLNKRIQVKGTLNEKSTVKVNNRLAIVKPDLTFEILLGVEEGDVEIKVVAADEAGNEAEKTINIKYQRRSS